MPLPTINDVTLVDPVLTNMLVGYMQSDMRFVASKVFPVVSVDDKSGTYGIFTKKYWFVDGLQPRSPNDKFDRSGYGIGSGTYDANLWGLEHAIADENAANNQLPMSLEQAGTMWLAQQSLIRKEKAFASAFMTTGVWGTDNTSVTKWSDFAGSDPVGNIRTAKRTVSQATGQAANTMTCGEIVEDTLLNHPDIIDRLKYVERATEANVRGALASLLGLADIFVSMAVQNTANTGQDASMGAIIDDDALICLVNPNAGILGVTAGKTFAWTGGGGAGSVTPYRDQSTKSDVLQHSEAWDQKAVATDVGYFFSDCVD